ncbi:MAG TPA: hypothetical protein VG937_08200 [Polyangiaceae bacterium]|nr:hypothetical protein [Polyangiaceae bacterium]
MCAKRDDALGVGRSRTYDTGCIEDADCGAGQICECGFDIGRCLSASCATDDDCGDGLCARLDDFGRCDDGSRAVSLYQCASGADACLFGKDCETFRCGIENGARACLERVPWSSPECVSGP